MSDARSWKALSIIAISMIGLCLAATGCNVGGSGNDPKVVSVPVRPVIDDPDDARTDVLTIPEILRIIEAAARRNDLTDTNVFPPGTRVSIAISDRIGNILQVWHSDPAATISDFDINIAGSLARTAAYMSHSQAPLTSRTMQFLHSFHYPPVFNEQETVPFSQRFRIAVTGTLGPGTCGTDELDPDRFSDRTDPNFKAVDELYAPVRMTMGILNTGQAPLWEINTTNRGGLNEIYDPNKLIPRLINPDGSLPNPGFTPLPGGIPLFKRVLLTNNQFLPLARRLVAAIGVYISKPTFDPITGLVNSLNQWEPIPEPAEEAAFAASRIANIFRNELNILNPGDPSLPTEMNDPASKPDDYSVNGTLVVKAEGGVFLGGILLAYLGDTNRLLNGTEPLSLTDTNVFPGAYDPAGLLMAGRKGSPDPFGWLITPRDSCRLNAGGLTAAEVETIILECVASSQRVHGAIRLPAISACQMIIAVSDFDGTLLGVFREPDATLFSLEVSISKARNAYYFSSPDSIDIDGPNEGRHPLFGVFGPTGDSVLTTTGIAVTARSLAFLTQPSFPPVIDGAGVGPLRCLIDRNATIQAFEGMGFAPPNLFIDTTFPVGDPNRYVPADPNCPIDPTRVREVESFPTNQSGIVFFPGSAPLYRNGVLVGGIGVSGDGVEQDDIVTAQGIINAEAILGIRLQPLAEVRCDRYSHKGVRVPYMKFPQNPRG